MLKGWALRLGLLLLSAAIVVLVAMLPRGVVATEASSPPGSLGEVRTDATQKFRIEPLEGDAGGFAYSWSLAAYGEGLRDYMAGLAGGTLTVDQWYGTAQRVLPLLPLLRETWWLSFQLFAAALVVGVVLGLLLGCLVLGSRAGRAFSLGLSVLGVSVPDFLLILLGQLLTIWSYRTFGVRLWSVLGVQGGERGWLLPLVALSIIPMAYTARLISTALDEAMRQEYIRTARAKGVPEVWVVLKHALRNALPRALNGMPAMLNVTLSSQLVVEVLTNHYGLGSGLMRGLSYSQPHVVATIGLIFCTWFLVMDGLAVTLRALANPQLKGGGTP
ncbi:ABC-type dipeptide/oligopeptide/nickel transport system permease component [Symbiobacterium terraclitae]|uniref:ABC-type dipeptide/oligopeptide/nickel transport system permease component n=1 Tax=Symbiobacterium terraclitae TaxID=557451 RepID=A0ABS4JS47_9FIRM|nr:ABC transporter permease subunit [Symbiobacterium terraclitae]MBP2017284.1 ABC-type dipeptide/oligopeptide/nickel transport system permease component [Symbiobacterium terraclitae]